MKDSSSTNPLLNFSIMATAVNGKTCGKGRNGDGHVKPQPMKHRSRNRRQTIGQARQVVIIKESK